MAQTNQGQPVKKASSWLIRSLGWPRNEWPIRHLILLRHSVPNPVPQADRKDSWNAIAISIPVKKATAFFAQESQ